MPPRRSAHVAAVAERASSALSPLPPALVHHVFSLLPADARARAACVCRGWRHVLLEPSLWTHLNLSPFSGVTRAVVTDAVLAGAAAKARGQLVALDVSECNYVTFDALLAVVQANGGALRELHVGTFNMSAQTLDADCVEHLLQAAPQLTACHAEVLGESSVADMRRMLCNEPPFAPLRLRSLGVDFEDDAVEASVLEVAADLAAHTSLKRVMLYNAPLHTLAALDAVVDAALARRLESVCFLVCRLSSVGAPALVRLLGSGTLTELSIDQSEILPDGPSTALLDALRANSTITSLAVHTDFWRDMDAAAALLSALTGHSSLHTLNFSSNRVMGGAAAVGAALSTLILANAPALTDLDVSCCSLGDAGLRPLVAALPANTHLRTLSVVYTNMSGAFARNVLLPAVRANTSLRTLRARDYGDHPGAVEATALVAARGGAGGAA
jgi:hypothetical protein